MEILFKAPLLAFERECVLPISCKAVAAWVGHCVPRESLSRLADLDSRGCLVAWDVCGAGSNSRCWVEVKGWQHWCSSDFGSELFIRLSRKNWDEFEHRVPSTWQLFKANDISKTSHLQQCRSNFTSRTSLMRRCTRFWRAAALRACNFLARWSKWCTQRR